MKKVASVLLVLVCLLSCDKEDVVKVTPECIENIIKEISKEGIWNPPAKLYSYSYENETVYYIPQRCCDFPSILLDKNCTQICSPDGGLSGQGDGKCLDFFEERTNEKLIWEDKREK